MVHKVAPTPPVHKNTNPLSTSALYIYDIHEKEKLPFPNVPKKNTASRSHWSLEENPAHRGSPYRSLDFVQKEQEVHWPRSVKLSWTERGLGV